MKKNLLLISILSMVLIFTLAFAGCGSTDESEKEVEEFTEEIADDVADDAEDAVDASEYGYIGTDPVEAAVYEYLVDEIGELYPDADVSIPCVNIFAIDESKDDEITVCGDFWLFNYDIDGDTLKTTSGGAHPGKMHLVMDDDNEYEVSAFDQVADGSDYEASAKEIFGEDFDTFQTINSDSEGREAARAATIADYVKANGLSVTKYQDEGADPVELIFE